MLIRTLVCSSLHNDKTTRDPPGVYKGNIIQGENRWMQSRKDEHGNSQLLSVIGGGLRTTQIQQFPMTFFVAPNTSSKLAHLLQNQL